VTVPRPHDALGLAPTASSDEVRTAYRLIALRHHPERTDGAADPERFREASAAYQSLVKGVAFEAGISNRRALELFEEAMQELAVELSRLGYDEVYIYRALAEEGCPPELATHAAREATYSAPRQRDRAQEPWRFSQRDALPLLEPAPRSGFGFAAKMAALGLVLCAALVGLAWFLPHTMERVRNVIEPFRSQVSVPPDTLASPPPYPSIPSPAVVPASPPAPAKPRIVQPRTPAQSSAGNDGCATDRDCPAGMRCMRPSIHDAWSCRP
jgi:hypothetical protein